MERLLKNLKFVAIVALLASVGTGMAQSCKQKCNEQRTFCFDGCRNNDNLNQSEQKDCKKACRDQRTSCFNDCGAETETLGARSGGAFSTKDIEPIEPAGGL